jgi:predicted transcriptional regulator
MKRKDKEDLVRLITDLGHSRAEAKVFTYFLENDKGTLIEIEKTMRLSRPQTSDVTKEMKEQGYLKLVFEKKSEKGRPKKIYYRITSVEAMIDYLEIKTLLNLDNIKKTISTLRETVKKE